MKGGFQLLLLVVSAPLFCRGAVDLCRDVTGFSEFPEDQTGFFSYLYREVAGAPTRTCEAVSLECEATIPNERLRQRIWYIDETKAYHGFGYRNNYIQVYNVRCPSDTVLHIIPLVLDTEDSSQTGTNCPSDDFVNIEIPSQSISYDLCGGEAELRSSPAYNNGLGLVVPEGRATVSFCSNGNSFIATGMAVRAMCIDPRASFLPRCVDFNTKLATELGSQFIDRINFVEDVEKANILHKRSAEDIPYKRANVLKERSAEDAPSLKRWGVDPKDAPLDVKRFMRRRESRRQKRFTEGDIIIQLTTDLTVTYQDNILRVVDSAGTINEFMNVEWLIALNDRVGTRIFDGAAPSELIIRGPGRLVVADGGIKAQVEYTIAEEDIDSLILPNNLMMSEIINIITRHVYDNYVRPFPFITPSDAATQTVPLPFASVDDPQGRYLSITELDFIQPDIQSGICTRNVMIANAPARFSMVDRNVFDFCRHYYYSCNAMLHAVCAEALFI